MDVKIIIGANYGDEGKGLATDYFGGLARDNERKTIGVLNLVNFSSLPLLFQDFTYKKAPVQMKS